MKMNEEEMKTKEEEEEEHLTRFHLQVKKKTETLLGPCGVCKGVRGVRGVRGRVRAESAWGPWSLWSPWGPWSPWSPRALWARIGPIPESEVKIHKKRFPKKGSYRVPKIPKITWQWFPQGSQVKVFQDSQGYIHCTGPHKLPK